MCADGITQLKGSSRVAVYRDVHHLVLQSRRGLRASKIAKVTVSHDSPCAGRYFTCIYPQIGDLIDATSYPTLNRTYVIRPLPAVERSALARQAVRSGKDPPQGLPKCGHPAGRSPAPLEWLWRAQTSRSTYRFWLSSPRCQRPELGSGECSSDQSTP